MAALLGFHHGRVILRGFYHTEDEKPLLQPFFLLVCANEGILHFCGTGSHLGDGTQEQMKVDLEPGCHIAVCVKQGRSREHVSCTICLTNQYVRKRSLHDSTCHAIMQHRHQRRPSYVGPIRAAGEVRFQV